MHLEPRELAPKQAPLCAPGRRPVDVFTDDLEDPGAGRWVIQRLAGTRKGWYYPQNPNDDPAWDGTWASSGQTNFYAPDLGVRSDTVIQIRQPVKLPEAPSYTSSMATPSTRQAPAATTVASRRSGSVAAPGGA